MLMLHMASPTCRSSRLILTSSLFAAGEEIPRDLRALCEGARLNRLDLREALRRDRVEAVGRLHRGVLLVVDGLVGAGEREEEDVALVGANLDGAVCASGELLDGEDGGARRRVEVAAVVDLVGDEFGHLPEERRGAAVEHSLVHKLEGLSEELHAGRLVDTARLGADDPVLKRVREPETIAAADRVGLLDGLEWRHGLAVHRHAAASLEGELNLLDLVGGALRPGGHLRLDDEHRGLHRLQVLSLVRETREVGVGRVLLLGADEGFDAKVLEGGRVGVRTRSLSGKSVGGPALNPVASACLGVEMIAG